MGVIAILAIPFIFYFNKTDFSGPSEKFARVYGRDISNVEAQKGARLYQLAQQLGMSSFVRALTLGAQSENDLFALFTLNRLILRHEADRLGLQSTTAEIAEFIRTLRPFLGPTGFDPKKYEEFAQNVLPANGFTEANLAEIATDELALRRIKELVATGVTVPEVEAKSQYEQLYGKMFVSVVRLQAEDFAKNIQITDEDVKKYHESHQAELKTDERRKVEFVTLGLNEEQKKLTGKERIDVLKKLSDRTDDFNQALLEKGAEFQQVAAKFQLPVETTGEFTRAQPDPKLKVDAQLAPTAFQLSKQESHSDAIQGPDGFYVVHLAGLVEARPLTLEEARPKIMEAIKKERSAKALAAKGSEIAASLRQSLASGAPLSFSLEKVGAKAEKVEPFTLSEDIDPEEAPKPETPAPDQPKDKEKEKPVERPADFAAIKSAAAMLQPNDVSDFQPWQEGGIIAILEKREPPDEAKFASKKETFQQRILTNKREIAFFEWLQERQREAGIIGARS
jgi:hypothetical protein